MNPFVFQIFQTGDMLFFGLGVDNLPAALGEPVFKLCRNGRNGPPADNRRIWAIKLQHRSPGKGDSVGRGRTWQTVFPFGAGEWVFFFFPRTKTVNVALVGTDKQCRIGHRQPESASFERCLPELPAIDCRECHHPIDRAGIDGITGEDH